MNSVLEILKKEPSSAKSFTKLASALLAGKPVVETILCGGLSPETRRFLLDCGIGPREGGQYTQEDVKNILRQFMREPEQFGQDVMSSVVAEEHKGHIGQRTRLRIVGGLGKDKR